MTEDRAIAGDLLISAIQTADVESFHACLDQVAREERYLALTRAPALKETHRFIEHNLLHKHIIEGRKRAGLYLGGAYHDTTQMGLLIPERSSASDVRC